MQDRSVELCRLLSEAYKVFLALSPADLSSTSLNSTESVWLGSYIRGLGTQAFCLQILCHLLTVQTWVHCFTSLCLAFLIDKIRLIAHHGVLLRIRLVCICEALKTVSGHSKHSVNVSSYSKWYQLPFT